jgi:hypothetical protein
MSWTSKCRSPSTRLAASRTVAKASTSRSSRVSPLAIQSSPSARRPHPPLRRDSPQRQTAVIPTRVHVPSCVTERNRNQTRPRQPRHPGGAGGFDPLHNQTAVVPTRVHVPSCVTERNRNQTRPRQPRHPGGAGGFDPLHNQTAVVPTRVHVPSCVTERNRNQTRPRQPRHPGGAGGSTPCTIKQPWFPPASTSRHASRSESFASGGRESVDVDEVLANGVHDRFVAGAEAELVEDVADVILDGVLGDEKALADLAGSVAFGDGLKDLDLAAGE